MAKKQCGYCVYMDVSKINNGTFRCEKSGHWKFANSVEADECRKYCERWRKDMYLGDQAIKMSKDYQEEHRPYRAFGFYVTTAIVNTLGFEDYDLNMLLNFRENYLEKDEKYREFLIKYDVIGPELAYQIQNAPNAQEIAFDLYKIYICGALNYIKRGRYGDAFIIYCEMIDRLMHEFCANITITDETIKRYNMEKSGHGRICLD